MKTEPAKLPEWAGDPPMEGYREAAWPQKGRRVFGPWCLLGAWPAVFGVVEKIDESAPEPADNPVFEDHVAAR